MSRRAAPPAVVFSINCPAREVLEAVSSKWAALLLIALSGRTVRFGALRREVEGISQKMLTQSLRMLERDGLVARRVHDASPAHVDYMLTDLGEDLSRVLCQLREWSVDNAPAIAAARGRFDG